MKLTAAKSLRTHLTRSGKVQLYLLGLFSLFLVLDSQRVMAQTKSQNYVYTFTPREAISSVASVNAGTSSSLVQKNVSYVDGLGRPLQSVIVAGSPARHDMVQPIVYDAFGRQVKQYLPYASGKGDGSYRANAVGEVNNFYNNPPDAVAKDAAPYAETRYETSPLNRVLEQGSPGSAWQPGTGHTTRFRYETNQANEVYRWQIGGSRPQVNGSVYYPAGELYRQVTTDEQGNKVIEYKNKLDQVVLKKVQEAGSVNETQHQGWACTYYIYDNYQNLAFVLPPQLVETLRPNLSANYSVSATLLNLWAFSYSYDDRRRMITKKVPGGAPIEMIYDRFNRLVLTQDGNQASRSPKEWTFTKYDNLNRPVMTGIYRSNDNRALLISAINSKGKHELRASNTAVGYTLGSSFPTTVTESDLLTITYYDSYSFLGNANWDAQGHSYQFVADAGYASAANTKVKGQVTGTKVKTLGNDPVWLNTVTYYDNKYRAIQTIREHLLSGTDRISTAYDFIGNATNTLQMHSSATQSNFKLQYRYTYDHANRLTQVYHRVGQGEEVLMVYNQYNKLGELIEKDLHYQEDVPLSRQAPTIVSAEYDGSSIYRATEQIVLQPGFEFSGNGSFIAEIGPPEEVSSTVKPMQSVDYRYNIRGWLTHINNSSLSSDGGVTNDDSNDWFGMGLVYNNPAAGFSVSPQFNGNIAAIEWSSIGLSSEPEKQRAYRYAYDRMNRLTNAQYLGKATSWSAQADYSVSNLTYDLNGNIRSLRRNDQAGGVMDNLTYDYTNRGNQLNAVTDNSGNDQGFTDGHSGSNDYTYDQSGNLTKDLNKKISSIQYNYLNLPTEVVITGKGTIKYTYDAAGTKLRQEVLPSDGSPTKTTDYVGGFHYTDGTLDFVQHDEGRLMIKDELAYHYDLKDHLGNTRVTFSNVPVTTTNTASMEASAAPVEEQVFEGVAESRQTLAFHNTTTASSSEPQPNKVARLQPGEQGPTKSVAVHAGDTVRLKVNARYETVPNQVQGMEGVATQMAGVLKKTAAGLESAGAITGSNGLVAAGVLTIGKEQEVPQAYLNYLLYDEDYQLIDQGFQQVSEAAAVGKTNPGAAPEELALEVPIQEEGFLYTYLSNEPGAGSSNSLVYFDDFTVEQQSYIVQVDDFYPFGLTHQQPLAENLANRYLYNGKELTNDFGLGWYDYGARMYDPSIGRWSVVDPRADDYLSLSPYNYVANDPIRLIDPDGEGIIDYLTGLANAVVTNHHPTQAGRGMGAPARGSVARSDYNAGQRAGDIVSYAMGVAETAIGGTEAAIGVLGAPETLGASLVLTAEGAVIAAEGLVVINNASKNLNATDENGRVNARGNNVRNADPNADADHSVVNRNGSTTYGVNNNNPNKNNKGVGFERKERIDTNPEGAPHVNKQTGESIPTPHRQSKDIPGGVEPIDPNKAPRYKGADDIYFRPN